MTDRQINQAIAAHLEITRKTGIPDFSGDLNEMHEAEKTLTKEQVREYQCFMYDMACEINATQGRWMPYSATARYRAEAFLKALGKWEEVQS